MPARQVIQAGIDALTRNEYKDIIVESLNHCIENKGMLLNAWIIMSNHLHLIASAKIDFTISNILRDFKKFTSKQIFKAIKENPNESRRDWMVYMFERAGKRNSNNKDFQFWQQDNHPIELSNPTVYHETSHASHYSQAGCNYWYTYRKRIAQETTIVIGNQNPPYGNGTEADAGVVALGEMWGYCMECIYTDRHYGNGGANGTAANGGFSEVLQNIEYPNDLTVGGLNAYLRAVENFNPNKPDDPDRWIPIGLPYDLRDPAGEILPVQDDVDGYTLSQIFHALESDVRTVPAFKDRLLLQNGNNQIANVNLLFGAYHY